MRDLISDQSLETPYGLRFTSTMLPLAGEGGGLYRHGSPGRGVVPSALPFVRYSIVESLRCQDAEALGCQGVGVLVLGC